MITIYTIPILFDNYTFLVSDGSSGIVIDPGEGGAVSALLKDLGITLYAILLTHHHGDHTGGAVSLHRETGAHVYGPVDHRSPFVTKPVDGGTRLTLGSVAVEILDTPGHTRSHVCYYLPAQQGSAQGVVFTGDTLFVGGCGRVFESSFSDMWKSLIKLTALPALTAVYCAHEYTLENYEFAASVIPGDAISKSYLKDVKKKVQRKKPTVPSTISDEMKSNIFLRSGEVIVQDALGMKGEEEVRIFEVLRTMKNAF